MSKTPDQLINELIAREGGYVDDPSDSGGETNYGVTKAVAVAEGYTGSMRDIPHPVVFNIYCKRYWVAIGAEAVYNVSNRLAISLFDWCVHSGPKTPSMKLQELLNVMNNIGTLYPDIKVDGSIGKVTIDTINKYVKVRGVKGLNVLEEAFDSLRIGFMVDLMLKREKDEKYGYGWLERVVDLHK